MAAPPPRAQRLVLVTALLCGACGETPVIQDTTRLGDTYDREGPYLVRAVIGRRESADAVNLRFEAALAGAASATVAELLEMSEVTRGVFEAALPGQPAFTHVRYWVAVEDGDTTVTEPTEGQGFGFWVLGPACTVDGECGPGESCDDSGRCRGGAGGCSKDAHCGRGFRCEQGRCVLSARSCTLDQGCLAGEVCDPLLEQCAPRPRCDGGLRCPEGFACDDGACLRSCAGDAECFPGEACAGGRCRPPASCTPGSCPAGLVCDPAIALCRTQGAAPCAPCARDADCGGPGDHCLVVGSSLACGRDCATTPCPTGYTCDLELTLPQCRPAEGRCP